VKDGKILGIGDRDEMLKSKGDATQVVDFVILNENPLTVDPMKIKDIKVVETIKEGKTIYRAR
jgi:predicted amidohydrolase YtcJ